MSAKSFRGIPLTNAQKRLVQAIRAIPATGRTVSDKDRFRLFVQTAVIGIWEGHAFKFRGEHVAWDYEGDVLGFSPRQVDDWKIQEFRVYDAILAYMEAVRNGEPWTDVLSGVFAVVSSSKPALGQHFTPSHMAEAMAKIALHERMNYALSNGKSFYLSDLCCGSGSLILAALKTMGQRDSKLIETSVVLVNDLDSLCAAMTTLQVVSNMICQELQLEQLHVLVGNMLTGVGKLGFLYAKDIRKVEAALAGGQQGEAP